MIPSRFFLLPKHAKVWIENTYKTVKYQGVLVTKDVYCKSYIFTCECMNTILSLLNREFGCPLLSSLTFLCRSQISNVFNFLISGLKV